MSSGKYAKKIMTGMLLVLAVMFAVPCSVEAKASAKKLKVDKTYKNYDMTGDKKADTFRVSGDAVDHGTYKEYKGYEVYLNGEKVLSDTGYILDITIYRLELKNGEVFAAIVPESNNGDVFGAAVYKYNNKEHKLKKLLDLYNMKKIGNHNNVSKISVSGNTIRVKHGVMSYSLASIGFSLDYQYKGGKLVQKSTQTKLTETTLKYQKKSYWTAKRSMTLLNKVGGKKIAAITKGKEIKIDKIYLNAKHTQIYLHVKVKGGRTGWVKGLTKYPGYNRELFEEVMYAG
ncbi:MAG TPA: hypothetical protein DF613_07735 [Lachnospiraceae bacterium]|nr:hypothetical protein [Lachnospiraceae bacterium]